MILGYNDITFLTGTEFSSLVLASFSEGPTLPREEVSGPNIRVEPRDCTCEKEENTLLKKWFFCWKIVIHFFFVWTGWELILSFDGFLISKNEFLGSILDSIQISGGGYSILFIIVSVTSSFFVLKSYSRLKLSNPLEEH